MSEPVTGTREAPVVELRGLAKRFGGVHAVTDVSLALHAGEVIGVVGHNGAGKSTLMQMVAGSLRPDAGEILLEGRPVRMGSPRDARRLGIEALYQDLALADNLDSVANVFLGRERTTGMGFLDEGSMEHAAREVLERVRPDFPDVHRPVVELSGGQRQAVAIARAIEFHARVLVLDEPTASLGPAETRAVGDVVRRLRDEGVGVFLVSHDLHDVFALSDRIAVMRAGRLESLVARDDTDPDALVELLVGGGGARTA